jgi:hypothetical protein
MFAGDVGARSGAVGAVLAPSRSLDALLEVARAEQRALTLVTTRARYANAAPARCAPRSGAGFEKLGLGRAVWHASLLARVRQNAVSHAAYAALASCRWK